MLSNEFPRLQSNFKLSCCPDLCVSLCAGKHRECLWLRPSLSISGSQMIAEHTDRRTYICLGTVPHRLRVLRDGIQANGVDYMTRNIMT